jgi:hypothetical protein
MPHPTLNPLSAYGSTPNPLLMNNRPTFTSAQLGMFQNYLNMYNINSLPNNNRNRILERVLNRNPLANKWENIFNNMVKTGTWSLRGHPRNNVYNYLAKIKTVPRGPAKNRDAVRKVEASKAAARALAGRYVYAIRNNKVLNAVVQKHFLINTNKNAINRAQANINRQFPSTFLASRESRFKKYLKSLVPKN